jgi:hypothetical protein
MGFTRIWGLAGIWLRRIVMLAAASSTSSEVSFRAKPQRSEAEEPRISPDAPQTLNKPCQVPHLHKLLKKKEIKLPISSITAATIKIEFKTEKMPPELPGMGDLSPLFPIF